MQAISHSIALPFTPAETDTSASAKSQQAGSAKDLASRLNNLPSALNTEAQTIAKSFVTMLGNAKPDSALFTCLDACCELINLLEEIDDFQPEGNSIKQKKQNLEDAVLGLSCLLNTHQVALSNEKSLNELLKFVKNLGTAADEKLSQQLPPSEKYKDKLKQQETMLSAYKFQLNILNAIKEAAFVKGGSKSIRFKEKLNEHQLLSGALTCHTMATRLNSQEQRFGNRAKSQMDEFEKMIAKIDEQLIYISNKSDNLDKDTSAHLANMQGLLTQLRASLVAKHEVLKNYISPIGAQKICEAKARYVSAAHAVLENVSKNTQEGRNSPAIKQALNNMSKRINRLTELSVDENLVDTNNLLGQKKLGFFQQLLHPLRAGRQENILKARARHFTTNDIDLNKTIGTTRYFTEEMFMQAVLEEALKPSGYSSSEIKKLLKAQISEVLNSHDWAEIKSSFQVPINSKNAQIMVPVTTTTKPAGNILTDEKTFKIVSTDSPITQKTIDEFRGKNFRDNNPKNPTIRGFNSHCSTETTHCTSLATTEMTIDGELAFAGTRHGVLSTYDLNPATIQSLPTEKREELMQTLSTVASDKATQLAIGDKASEMEKKSLPALPDTDLQKDIKAELKKLGIKDDQFKTVLKDSAMLAVLAAKSPKLCQLVNRVANLNRAREAFITELKHNKKLQAKVENGKVSFNSISLLTPDQIRAAKNQITGENNSENERQMLIEQRQAWKDLQNEIDGGGIHVNGKQLEAKIRSFNFGVNKGALELSSNPVVGELVSGWQYVHEQNTEGMHELFGEPQDSNKLGEVQENLEAKSTELQQKHHNLSLLLQAKPFDKNAITELDKEIKALTVDIRVIEQLRDQIMQMWEDKNYQRGGNEPYKMANRMALLSFLLDGGTLFNCKSGKDRTAQLDIETKFLAFQIKTNNGTVPIPDHKRTVLEKIQMAVFTFEDESRRTMQEYNTGHGGSKLRGAWALYDAFTVAFSDSVLAIKEYLGGSGNAGS